MRFALAIIAVLAGTGASVMAAGTLGFRVRDADGRPLPCRVHLRDAAGTPAPADELPPRVDHLAFDGDRTVTLPAGRYSYAIERSPEWERAEGEVTIADDETREVEVAIGRIVEMSERGWFSGDLHIHRGLDEIEQLVRSSDLDIAPVITWWNSRNLWSEQSLPASTVVKLDGGRFSGVMAGEDEREGGALLYFGLKRPIDITKAEREFPSPMRFVEEARAANPDMHLDIEKPFWWDVPVWVALAEPDTIGLANNHMCRARMLENEAWGRPRDVERLPAPRGNGFWTQEIYYHVLNAGLRIPPSAGSASGVLPNPVGYNRVYVHLEEDLAWDRWWDGLRAGRSFVTNGPLLDVRANGALPGTVFQRTPDNSLRISLDVMLITADPVPAVEVICNGQVVKSVPCEDRQSQHLQAEFTVEESGWFLVRAITENPRTFRFASTAPYYVERGDKPRRISRASAQFFLDWIDERIARVPGKLADPQQRRRVLRYHEQARDVWQQKVDAATAP